MLAFLQKLLQNPKLDKSMEQVCILRKMSKDLGNKAHKCLKERFRSTLKFFRRIIKKHESLAGFKVDPNHSSRCV